MFGEGGGKLMGCLCCVCPPPMFGGADGVSLSPPALQLPLVSDGGGRAVLPEGTQHPPPPSRPRNMLGLPQPPFLVPRSMER